MINTMEVDAKRQVKSAAPGTKFILAEDLPIEAEIIPYFPQNYNLTINELGKQLLKASTDGNLEDIRMLMGKGAPFTADWLGTSPLHLAAQNNHLEVCEVLLRAGMLKDARTKVDRTPLHMAAYEGHLDIVECLLKNGADYDAKDLLHMTPLHWAAQNGHAEVATLLIRYGATTNIANKFDLTPVDIAMQINRPDIVQIINLGIRDPISATEHLALELISENSTGSTIDDPVMAITESTTEAEDGEEPPSIPFEAIMVEEEGTENSEETTQQFEEHIQELPAHIETVEEEDGNFSESIKYLQQHGITMLPVDDSTILNSVMESGHSVVLTEAGKQALNSIKSEANQEIKEYLIPKTKLTTIKKKKIITVTPEEYLAMTSSGQLSSQPNILKQINGKIINTIQRPPQIKRIVMKKNKVIPISPHITKIQKVEKINDVEFLMEQLKNAQTLIESYKKKLFHSEVETARYKRKLKLLMEQNKISSSI